jgi:transcriptional antiterminator RfaH
VYSVIINSPPAWYVVHVKRHSEFRVVKHLTSESIPTFLPLVESIRARQRRRSALLEPLFPGYLFVRMERVANSPNDWHVVRWTPGVRLILGSEGTPMPVPGGVVEGIQERVSEYGFVRPGIPFQPRTRVRFRTGPLIGLEALFEHQISRPGRVRVLMMLLGQQTAVEVDTLDLECA